MENVKIRHENLPLEQIETDSDQPRKDIDKIDAKDRLLISIKRMGIQQPIAVREKEKDRYIIIDGHRRYFCARMLGLKVVPCLIHPKMKLGETERIRYELQNNRKSWKPLERSECLSRIKEEMGFKTNRELGEFLNLSIAAVAGSLQLRKQKLDYLELMAKYDLSDAYQVEFVRLRQKLRKVGEFDVDQIIRILFEKVQNNVVTSAKGFRKLGKIFLRANANEKQLYEFLSDPDMRIEELEQRTTQSRPALLIEELIKILAENQQNGVLVEENDRKLLLELGKLIKNLT